MAGEQVTNFATSALVGALSAPGTSFTVTTSQGALFPTGNFCVTIDSEIILISSRSGDVFTIGQRGYDGTVAASHSSGATVQCSFIAQLLKHLWQNIPDSYAPQVPPAYQMAGLSASAWDNEFESLGSWTLYPASPSSGSIWNANSSLRSHLLLDRGATDNTSYFAYIAFNPPASTPYIVTMKLSIAVNWLQPANTNDQFGVALFVTDQTNPVAGAGNRFQVICQYLTNVNTSGASYFAGAYSYNYTCQVFGQYFVSGASHSITPLVTPSPAQTLFIRISFDGANTYTAYLGDGWTYWPIGQKNALGFTPQALGVNLGNYVPNGSGFNGTAAIDYIRVATGSVNPRFGS